MSANAVNCALLAEPDAVADATTDCTTDAGGGPCLGGGTSPPDAGLNRTGPCGAGAAYANEAPKSARMVKAETECMTTNALRKLCEILVKAVEVF